MRASPAIRGRWWVWVSVTVLLLTGLRSLRAGESVGSAEKAEARAILEATGVHGGLIVDLGCGDGHLLAALRSGHGFLVQGLDRDAAKVEAARRHVDAVGLSGMVSVAQLRGKDLPYVDNLVRLVVVEGLCGVPLDEVMRVLAPGGTAYVKSGGTWQKTVKPWPADIDQWTEYLHGPDNNAVAHDTRIGAPRHMQWLAAPLWTRNHHTLSSLSAVVTAGGRLFAIVDQASPANINLPARWALVARDAFSGVTLWKRPIRDWASYKIHFRSGPPQLPRLLIASGDRVYAPLGLDQPVTVMDAATGKTVATFPKTAGVEEMVLVQRLPKYHGPQEPADTLLVLRGEPVTDGKSAAEQANFQAWFKEARPASAKSLMAVDVRTGKTLWTWSDPKTHPMPETLASDGKNVYLQIDQQVLCLDLASGRQRWRYGTPGETKIRRTLGFGRNTLVVADNVVLCNLADRLTAIGARDGKRLWDCAAGGGFHSPLDVFVIHGLVWQGSHVSDSVAPPAVNDFNEGRDLHTGEVKTVNTVEARLQTAGHHHRCYREKATDRFIITSKRGIEMMDVDGGRDTRDNWVRGTCQYGIMPANGLLYVPPHSCGCYMEAKLRGFWALAAESRAASDPGRRIADDARLETGPAYGKIDVSASPDGEAWPTYRHDPLRRGVASTTVPAELTRAWQTVLGGRLTQPVVASGRVVVAGVDDGAVYALDAASGKVLWKYLAGGRVDSPPTLYRGTVLLGSADGRVTCLRLSDGAVAWRFFAAPADLRTVAFDRVESVWPVHGSVLVLGGSAYVAAGRSTWIDGGIDLWKLDPATGRVLSKTRLKSRHPYLAKSSDHRFSEGKVTQISQNVVDDKTLSAPDHSDAFSMGGTVSDVLVSDGTNVYLHQMKLDAGLQVQDRMSRHLFSTSSLLDDSGNHRSHWVLGTGDFRRIPVAYSWIVNWPARRNPTIAVPAGMMMVFDNDAVWGVRTKGNTNGKYEWFKKQNRPFSDREKSLPDFRSVPKDQRDACIWKHDLPVRTTAMLKSGDRLFLGVMPIDMSENDPRAAGEGRGGCSIWVCSESDGGRIAQFPLDSPVVWDGMAAASGRLYAATVDGRVQCLSGPK